MYAVFGAKEKKLVNALGIGASAKILDKFSYGYVSCNMLFIVCFPDSSTLFYICSEETQKICNAFPSPMTIKLKIL